MELSWSWWVAILLGLALGVGQVYHLFSHRSGADYQARAEQLGVQNVIAAFQRRRRRGLRIAGVLVLATFPLFYASQAEGWGGLIGASVLAFGVGFVTLVWSYRCPVCGVVPLDADGLDLNPDACAKCGARLAPLPEEPASLREQAAAGTVAPWRRAGLLRRVHLFAEGNRLVLVKNQAARLLELICFLGICALWWWFLIVLEDPGPGWGRVGMVLAALFPLAFGPYVYGLLVTVVAGDVFTFYRRTDRLVRNGRVVCALSEIDHVLLRPPALSLVLKSERRLRIDTSAWGDLPGVAAAIGAFLGVMVVTRTESDT